MLKGLPRHSMHRTKSQLLSLAFEVPYDLTLPISPFFHHLPTSQDPVVLHQAYYCPHRYLKISGDILYFYNLGWICY